MRFPQPKLKTKAAAGKVKNSSHTQKKNTKEKKVRSREELILISSESIFHYGPDD